MDDDSRSEQTDGILINIGQPTDDILVVQLEELELVGCGLQVVHEVLTQIVSFVQPALEKQQRDAIAAEFQVAPLPATAKLLDQHIHPCIQAIDAFINVRVAADVELEQAAEANLQLIFVRPPVPRELLNQVDALEQAGEGDGTIA